jgi:cytidine deaminase
MDKIAQELLSEAKEANAPVTRFRVACIIETKRGRYYGHNNETRSCVFRHAEENAIASMKRAGDSTAITKIYMGGTGGMKIKQIAPCNECYVAMSPFMSNEFKLILYEPDTFERRMIFGHNEVRKSYSNKRYAEIKGNTIKSIIKDLKSKTDLAGTDLRFVANLRLFGLQNGIKFYITGSKSGRGGIGTLIYRRKGRRGGDVDLMAVSNGNPTSIRRKFGKFASRFYKIKSSRRVEQKIYFINETRSKTFYYDTNGRQVLDLCIGKSLRGAMSRMYYYRKNWWHRLS